MDTHYNELKEEYYSYLIGKIVCTCNSCWDYKTIAEQYFPHHKEEIQSHWNDLIHK